MGMTDTERTAKRAPWLDGGVLLTDAGLETALIFHEGWELPMFAAFVLAETDDGHAALNTYYDRYLGLAADAGAGFMLEAPTWRANPDWGRRLGYDLDELERVNRACIQLMQDIRRRWATRVSPIAISGCIGPRGDGYDAGVVADTETFEAYHAWQVGVMAEAGVDLVSAFTMTSIAEGVGVARAARAQGVACVVSFTLETDGRLPTGESLPAAIAAVDAATDGWPLYFMINCAHPTHFDAILTGEPWTRRLGGLRANASRRSHAELDNSADLDIGDPAELGAQYAALYRRFPQLKVLGGCCGTDHRHIDCIGRSVLTCEPVPA
jgi:S-methylmethionine-dependent homocysteine/selenocysteine methylase